MVIDVVVGEVVGVVVGEVFGVVVGVVVGVVIGWFVGRRRGCLCSELHIRDCCAFESRKASFSVRVVVIIAYAVQDFPFCSSNSNVLQAKTRRFFI